MKQYFLLLIGTSLCAVSFAQVSTEGLRDEFSQVSKYGTGNKTSSGYEGLHSFSNANTKGSQFYFPGWLPGSLISPTGETTATDYLYLYDKVRQTLFIKPKASDAVLEVSKDKIGGFTVTNNDSTHHFVHASLYNPENKTDFYEVVLKDDAGYTLLKSVKTKYVKFDPSDMVKVRNGDMADEFDDDVTYYVSYKDGAPQAIKLKDNSIKKALAQDKNKVNNYLSDNFSAERNESFLVGLIRSLNS